MSPCETHESALSSAIDGELEPIELTSTLDHLVACPSCREFYRRSRALEALLLEATASAEGPAPEAVWGRIRNAARDRAPASKSRLRRSSTWVALAASLLLIAGLGSFTRWGAVQAPADAYVEVLLEQDRGRMDDERFLELARELLEADRRYHEKMRDVMELVTRRPGRESPEEGERESREDGRAVVEALRVPDRTWEATARAL